MVVIGTIMSRISDTEVSMATVGRDLKCSDVNHDSRSAQPGFQDIVGERTDLAPGPAMTTGHDMICTACANALRIVQAQAESTRQAEIASAKSKLVGLGFTNSETRFLVNEDKLP